MKTKLSGLFLLVLMAVLISCEKEKDEVNNDSNSPTGCNGILSANATGGFSAAYCFSTLYNYNLTDTTMNITINGDVDGVIVSFNVMIGGYGKPDFNGTQTYSCGVTNEPCYFEVIYHGNNNEYYKCTGGTVSIVSFNASSCKATFNVSTRGYYNQQDETFSGSIEF